MRSVEYDRHVSVDSSLFDAALEISVRGGDEHEVTKELRIPIEEVPEFLRAITAAAVRSIELAARRLEVGHCETCGNTGTVVVELKHRNTTEYCPDCRGRWPSEPFANTPKVGRLKTDD